MRPARDGAGRRRSSAIRHRTKSRGAHKPPHWSNRRIESAQRLQIAKEIVEIAVAQPVGAEDRHRRPRAVLHGLHLVLLVSLNPLARVHDLDREEIFVLLHAVDRRPVCGVSVTGSNPGRTLRRRGESAARSSSRDRGDADARQVGPEASAGAIHPMTTGAVRRERSFAVLGVAARRIGRGGRGQRTQVGEDLPRFSVDDARVGRHLGARRRRS